jgi:hypothetical protein
MARGGRGHDPVIPGCSVARATRFALGVQPERDRLSTQNLCLIILLPYVLSRIIHARRLRNYSQHLKIPSVYFIKNKYHEICNVILLKLNLAW